MDLPENRFKSALCEGRQQIGLWCSLPGGYAAEVAAGAGYDWLLFDTEHSPGDPLTVLEQLQAVAPYGVSAVVRPASNDTVLIKRFLDLGAQTLLIPYVQDAAEARAAVAATRYPPDGIRGVSGLTRATRFGRIANYSRSSSGSTPGHPRPSPRTSGTAGRTPVAPSAAAPSEARRTPSEALPEATSPARSRAGRMPG